MSIFGKRLSEYVAFARWFLILIPAVGIARLSLSLEGAPNASVQWLSMTALMWIAVVYYAIRIQTANFGSYRQLLVLCALSNFTSQIVSITGIGLAIFTGHGNIFSAPEFAFGSEGASWLHLGAHLTVGMIAGAVAPWLIGSAIVAATKKLTRVSSSFA